MVGAGENVIVSSISLDLFVLGLLEHSPGYIPIRKREEIHFFYFFFISETSSRSSAKGLDW